MVRAFAFAGCTPVSANGGLRFRMHSFTSMQQPFHLRCRSRRVRMDAGDSGSVPVNVPAGVLLAISSVFAIASVGCVFELGGGHPQYGQPVTLGILTVSFPGFLGLFYAAIKKGQAEAEED